jgi:tetratricopeptide (TPR) repeat protein
MLGGQGPQHKKRLLIILGVTILLAGAVIGMVTYNLLQGKAGESKPDEALTPAPQQVIFEKIPPPAEPVRSTAGSEPRSSREAKSDQRSPEKPKVLQVAAQQEPVPSKNILQQTMPPEDSKKPEQQAAAAITQNLESTPETGEQPRQPGNEIKVGMVSLESAEEVDSKQDPVRPEKHPLTTAPPFDDSVKEDQTFTVAAAKRQEPAQTTRVKVPRPGDGQKAGLVDLQTESTPGTSILYRKAVAYQKEMKWQKAIETYQRLLKLEPMSAEVYNNLGVCYEKKGDFKMAAKSYEKAISINPRFYPSYNNLGIIYYRLKNFDKARAAYEQALQLNPNNSQSEINLALVYERLRRRELAQRTLERVLVNEPENAEAHYNLGRMLENQGRSEAALEHYRQFLTSNSSAYPQLREKVKDRVRSLEEDANK